jgi:hypothetical protein
MLSWTAFFEGLAGADADIDAVSLSVRWRNLFCFLCFWKVFELEEEFDSALDTADTNDDFSILNQRRLSGASMRGRASSPPKTPARARHPTMNRGSESQTLSPLAQVFNPLVVEDDLMREPCVSPGVSYGPATRRRLLSIQPSQRRPQPEPLSTQFQSNQLKRFPKSSDSQDRHAIDHAMTAAEIKDMEDNMNGDLQQSAIMKRLDDMEKRQERIESLLQDLSHNISVITK